MIEIITPVGEVINRLEKVISLNRSQSNGRTLTYDEFLKRPLPHTDIPQSNAGVTFALDDTRIQKLLDECAEILGFERVTNCTRMEANTQLPWHTNSNGEGFRIYYTKGQGCFKYIDENGEQQISNDNPDGWTCRKFKVLKDKLFWHSVYAETTRYAFGFGNPL